MHGQTCRYDFYCLFKNVAQDAFERTACLGLRGVELHFYPPLYAGEHDKY